MTRLLYTVSLSHLMNPDTTMYRFTSEEKRDEFLKNLPPFYQENKSFVHIGVVSMED